MKTGNFVISLDFELIWGVRDHRDIGSYGENVVNVRKIIPKLLELFDQYEIKATFAVVGFIFFKSREELLENIPKSRPTYFDDNMSPYNGHLNLLQNPDNYKYHFAPELIRSVKERNHEVASHTFSHYYCMEAGQTEEQFKDDLQKHVEIAQKKGYDISSIIFPRNQCASNYYQICADLGIKTYRGNENSWVFNKTESKVGTAAQRAIRFADRYVNLTGFHCHDIEQVNSGDSTLINIPSSRFLAPYNKKLSSFENLRLRRITRSMEYAAKNSLTFHLWWHPHNFGSNMKENFYCLERILKHYKSLRVEYLFQSKTMSQLQTEHVNHGKG